MLLRYHEQCFMLLIFFFLSDFIYLMKSLYVSMETVSYKKFIIPDKISFLLHSVRRIRNCNGKESGKEVVYVNITTIQLKETILDTVRIF